MTEQTPDPAAGEEVLEPTPQDTSAADPDKNVIVTQNPDYIPEDFSGEVDGPEVLF